MQKAISVHLLDFSHDSPPLHFQYFAKFPACEQQPARFRDVPKHHSLLTERVDPLKRSFLDSLGDSAKRRQTQRLDAFSVARPMVRKSVTSISPRSVTASIY